MEGSRTAVGLKVMVAIDESEFSEYALRWTLDNLCPTLSDSQLIVFTAHPSVDFSYMYATSWGTNEERKTLQHSLREASLAVLEKAKNTCNQYGIVAEALTDAGDPKDVICKTIDKLNVQLLVVGSHGRGAFKSTFLGSVSNYCVHHASCPVLVVKKIT